MICIVLELSQESHFYLEYISDKTEFPGNRQLLSYTMYNVWHRTRSQSFFVTSGLLELCLLDSVKSSYSSQALTVRSIIYYF
jgi:hypothetical protein